MKPAAAQAIPVPDGIELRLSFYDARRALMSAVEHNRITYHSMVEPWRKGLRGTGDGLIATGLGMMARVREAGRGAVAGIIAAAMADVLDERSKAAQPAEGGAHG